MEPGPIPPPIPGITIERADGAGWDRFLDASAEGFGMPRALAESLFSASVQADRRLRAFVGIVDGRAVAAGASVRIGNTVGIYSVATIPEARGRGYGTALTWHTLADADPGWEVAVLQASEMGRPIYERMGFKLVREFAELIGPASA
jgi:GNAT superfamily N-acetyltransferase